MPAILNQEPVMSSSPVCTCGVCPAHGPTGPGADHPGAAAGWADPARRYLESAVEWLDGPEAMGAGHGELEARLQVHSREQYRLLLQGHLDERARLEKRRSAVTGADAVSRPRVENGHHRGLSTVFGTVTVTRKAYRAVPGTTAGEVGSARPTASDALPGPAPDLMADGTDTAPPAAAPPAAEPPAAEPDAAEPDAAAPDAAAPDAAARQRGICIRPMRC
jgi:hypothetical protein